MGYRSCVALMLYGTPDKVDMVEAMLLQKLNPEYDRALFERVKQMRDEEVDHGKSKATQRTILWTFDDIKWYSELDSYKDDLFRWVDDINEAVPDHERDYKLAVEFVRVGEEYEDNEVAYSIYADNALSITRNIEIPDNFEWRT
jgi:hypothetical protein